MHNFIVEKECDDSMYDQEKEFQGNFVVPQPGPLATFAIFLQVYHRLRDRATQTNCKKI
jgi:hypothetical protein